METKITIGELIRKNIGKAASIAGLVLLTGTVLSGCATTDYSQPYYYNSNVANDVIRMNRDATNDLIRISKYR